MEKVKERINPLLLFAIGFLIAGLGLHFQIQYVILLYTGFLVIIAFYGHPLWSVMAALFTYNLVPDILTLLLIYGIFGLYIFRKLTRKERIFQVEEQEVMAYIYFILMIIATATSSMVSGSFRDLAIHTAGVLLMILILDQTKERKNFHKIVCILSLATTILALYGIFQYFTGIEIKEEWVDVASNSAMRARVYSIFGNPNIFAEYLVMMTPLTVGLFWSTNRDSVRIFYFSLFVIQVIALFMTMSRGGWIGLAFSALVFLFFIRKRLLLFAVPMGVLSLFLLPASFLSRFLTIFNLSDSSTSYRFKIWEITGEVIRDNFLVGVGLGHLPFKYTFEKYIRTMPIYHAHNSFIEIFAELGLVGFILFLLFVLSIFLMLWKYPLKSSDSYNKIMGAALIASFSGMMIHGMFENIFYMTKITTGFWILLALAYSLVRTSKERRKYDVVNLGQGGKEVIFNYGKKDLI